MKNISAYAKRFHGLEAHVDEVERDRLKEGAAILQSANFEGHTTSKSPL
jgi:hypothetical protein